MCMYCENEEYTIRISVDKWNKDKKIWEPENNFEAEYCPMCRKEAGRVKRHASGYWYQFIIPRRLTLPPTRIYRWLNFYWRLKDKEE